LTRVIDIVAPIGLGQRMLIVAPPKTGKTIMLQKICHAITQNRPEVQQMVLLVDERPEEVTDFRRTVKADVFASSSDRPTDELIFEEFKGTGNSEINLDRQLAEKRIFPAINIQTSGTRKEEKLFSQHEYEKVKKLRGALFALKPVEAMERLLKSLNEFGS